MPRPLKPQKLDVYRDNTVGLSVDLYLDRNHHDFFFELAGTTYRAPSMDALARKAYDAVRSAHQVNWEPVIAVHRLEPFACNVTYFVGFEIKRFWVGRKADRCWIRHDWEESSYERDHTRKSKDPEDKSHWVMDADNFADSKFELYAVRESHTGREKDIIHLPYSAATWSNLEFIQSQITVLRNRLDDLMTTKEGIARLEAPGGIKLIASGRDDAKD